MTLGSGKPGGSGVGVPYSQGGGLGIRVDQQQQLQQQQQMFKKNNNNFDVININEAEGASEKDAMLEERTMTRMFEM